MKNHHLEIGLMHHYTAFTSLTMSHSPALISVWRDVVPQLALDHEFLLHGLFALAAQHRLSHLSTPADNLLDASIHYHEKSLSRYIALVTDISKDNCEALFAFSQIITGTFYSRLSIGLYEDGASPQDFVASVANIFELLKGTLVVAQQATSWLRQGQLAAMMSNYPETKPGQFDETSIAPQQFEMEQFGCTAALKRLSQSLGREAAATDTIMRARVLIPTIQLVHALLIGQPDTSERQNKIVGLPVWFDRGYAQLLREGDNAALVVLAFYGVALHELNQGWMFREVGSGLIHAVSKIVQPEWLDYLEWPSAQISRPSQR